MSNLGINPYNGSYEDYAENYAKALWLEQWRLKNMAELLSAIFRETNKH